jgi:hypothetical protein
MTSVVYFDEILATIDILICNEGGTIIHEESKPGVSLYSYTGFPQNVLSVRPLAF